MQLLLSLITALQLSSFHFVVAQQEDTFMGLPPPTITDKGRMIELANKVHEYKLSGPIPAKEVWKHIPLPPDDYPEFLKGVFWMDQGAFYGWANLPLRKPAAPENLFSLADINVDTYDPDTRSTLSLGGCGAGWSHDDTPQGEEWYNSLCGKDRDLPPVIFQFQFDEDFIGAEFWGIVNGNVLPPQALGYRGVMVRQLPQDSSVCPPPSDATRQERNLCAPLLRHSYAPSDVNFTTPYTYPVFQVVNADGDPIEPYLSAYVDAMKAKNATMSRVNLLKEDIVSNGNDTDIDADTHTDTTIDTGVDDRFDVESSGAVLLSTFTMVSVTLAGLISLI